MQDVCKMLGIKKLNTTSHYPQCNGMIERFNHTLKTMLRKHVCKFGVQWDNYLYGLIAMFLIPQQERNLPFLLYGFNCHHPMEAALLPPKSLGPIDVSDYHEELVLSLSSARALANKANAKSQSRQKAQYDKQAVSPKLKVGDWVLIYFPEDETGKLRKLSRPWRGPYHIINRNDPDISAKKLFFPEDPAIQVHQSRVQKCPSSFPKRFLLVWRQEI